MLIIAPKTLNSTNAPKFSSFNKSPKALNSTNAPNARHAPKL